MFQKLSLSQKITLLFVLYSVVAIAEYFIHRLCLIEKSVIKGMLLTLIECCILMLSGFFYFQTFKFHRIWKSYYSRKSFESPNYFRMLGVPLFQFILINSFMRFVNQRVYLKGRKRDYVKTLHEETKQSETAHIVSLLVTIPFQVDYFKSDELLFFWSLTFFSIFFNVYPILLQRKNRFLLESRLKNLLRD